MPSNPWIAKVGNWNRFGGLRYHHDSTLLKGDVKDENWYFALGVNSTEYRNWFPAYVTNEGFIIQAVDLWLRLKDISLIKFLPEYCLPSHIIRTKCLGNGLLCAAAAVLIDDDIAS